MESFSPFRAVGSVCGDVPISSTMLYGAPVLMVATGRTFQLFRGKELSMLRGGPHFLNTVRSVAQAGKYRFVAEGHRVHAFTHHKPLWTCVHNEITQSKVEHMLAADELLFCVGQDKRVVVREVKTGKVLGDFLIERSETVNALILPAGYSNKLLVATAEGSLHLYNFKTGKLIWYGLREPHAQIMSLATSAYKDIVAYGTSRGHVVVFNFGTNEEVMTFDHSDETAVTALAFRVDKDILVSGTSVGEVALWDLESRALDGVLTRSRQVATEAEAFDTPHTNAVHTIVVLPTETASIVTAGADNALMQFRFDTVDGCGALVRERRGHMGGCTAARFYNADLMITAGTDRALRVTHIFSDRASWELSQGKLGRRGRDKQMSRESLKVTQGIALASCTTRNYQWSSVVSLHEASAQMCGWRMDTRALEFKLSGITTSAHTARVVAMSNCGNFAVVGYSSGNVTAISMQNRSIKHLFDESLTGDRAHAASVECVEVACGNAIVVTAGLDARIKLWDLIQCRLRTVIETSCPMTKSCIHQPSSLFIVAQHFTINVFHCNPDVGLTTEEISTPVRTFDGHNGPITAITLAPDSHRYIVSTSGDCALLIWDLAAAACVGQYRFTSPATSLHFHPNALFMVSTHAGERGAFLWSNNLRYGFVPEVVVDPKGQATEQLPLLHFPTAQSEMEDNVDESKLFKNNKASVMNEANTKEGKEKNDVEEEKERQALIAESVTEAELFNADTDIALARRQREQQDRMRLDSIVTDGLRLAGVPRSTWFNLTILDQIKEKNQPILPPKKRDVPFFLPTTQELRPTFLLVASANGTDTNNGDADKSTKGTRMVQTALGEPTPVQRMLMNGEHDALMAYLLELRTPQAIDLEIKRSVDYMDGGQYTAEEIERMTQCLSGLLEFVETWLRRRENVDFVQGIIADLIRSHGPLLTKCGEGIISSLEEIAELQNGVRYSLDHLVGYPNCLVGSFTGTIF